MPASFDPAKAAAPPETDVVRAVFEGLTDLDPKTLQAVPAVAKSWTSSKDFKTWTFELREDARWSNNEKVTAEDFVRSWSRLRDMGDGVGHRGLLTNIVGLLPTKEPSREPGAGAPTADSAEGRRPEHDGPAALESRAGNEGPSSGKRTAGSDLQNPPTGIKAIGPSTLEVSLVVPDREFPSLVAHPMFRPIHRTTQLDENELAADIVTNGAFRVTSVGRDGIALDRSENYWNRDAVSLERVRFVPHENAETALESYKKGEIDAVTNADFEPLALKLMETYEDFRRTVHSALNFYEFNRDRPPFDDRRVREALTISIERERLADDDMKGASKPALGFLPYAMERRKGVSQNVERARELLTEAGFPEGRGFPTVKLVINRNNTQQKIAESVAEMWLRDLNVRTEIVVKEGDELEAAIKERDYDLLRRGVVLPTSDETANMLSIFPDSLVKEDGVDDHGPIDGKDRALSRRHREAIDSEAPVFARNKIAREKKQPILTEEAAVIELPAIPLYFPTSYSLVKPYVEGFEINTLDAPSLKNVRINSSWQPASPAAES